MEKSFLKHYLRQCQLSRPISATLIFMAEFQFLPPTRPFLGYPPGVPEPPDERLREPPPPAEGNSPASTAIQGREVRQTRQRVLFCRCGSSSIWARGLCQRCYSRVRADERQFAGLRERVLDRDGHTCRGCQATTVETVLAVHHRQPGVSSLDLLVTLCPACHALVERTEVLFRDVPELLRVLWRELHPQASEQLPLFS
jgi:hypothetical protein